MNMREKYIMFRSYIDKGVNDFGWLKNIVAVVFYTGGLSFILDVPVYIGILIGSAYGFGGLLWGYLYYEKLQLLKYEVEFSNKRHDGVKTLK